jgi:hypothetical protein
MKTTLFFTFAFFINARVFSQDVINIKDGSPINAKVIEITESQVKYKDQANPDGPLYIMNKDKISSIHYKNGSDDVFSSNTSSATSNSSLTTIVNGYNTDSNSSPSNYANIPANTASGSTDNGNYSNNVNRGAKTLMNIAGLGIFAILTANSWNNASNHSVNYNSDYFRGGNCNRWRRGGWCR